MLSFLSTTPARVLTAALILHSAAFYGMSRSEPVRIVSPLSNFPKELSGWKMIQEGVVEKEVMDVLKADDVITRWYGNAKYPEIASLFVAYFTTQRNGKAPHSPQNCLPGSGWLPVLRDRIYVPIEGESVPLEANRFIVARGEDKSLVIYWYQTQRRTVASEYTAKIYTVLDAIRYNRSDAAIVKVTIPIRGERTQEEITAIAQDFIQIFYAKLKPYFPA